MNSVLLAIVGYVLIQFAIGVWVSRRMTSASEYILAGRSLGTGLVVFSVFATYFGAEAIVVLNPEASEGLKYLRKLNMQLASKMRFVSAQLIALLEGGLWLRSASHANAMARRLRDALDAGIAAGDLPGLGFTQETQSNGVFATLPAGVADRLRDRGFRFYDWDASRNEVRWMCSFDTSEADIDDFVAGIREELHAAA